jgi:hypothetical protein
LIHTPANGTVGVALAFATLGLANDDPTTMVCKAERSTTVGLFDT